MHGKSLVGGGCSWQVAGLLMVWCLLCMGNSRGRTGVRAGEQVRRDGSRKFEWTAMRALLESVMCRPACKPGERKGDRERCWAGMLVLVQLERKKQAVGLA